MITTGARTPSRRRAVINSRPPRLSEPSTTSVTTRSTLPAFCAALSADAAIFCHERGVARAFERATQEFTRVEFVFDEQDGFSRNHDGRALMVARSMAARAEMI